MTCERKIITPDHEMIESAVHIVSNSTIIFHVDALYTQAIQTYPNIKDKHIYIIGKHSRVKLDYFTRISEMQYLFIYTIFISKTLNEVKEVKRAVIMNNDDIIDDIKNITESSICTYVSINEINQTTNDNDNVIIKDIQVEDNGNRCSFSIGNKKSEDNKFEIKVPFWYFLLRCKYAPTELRNINVLYIGQAFRRKDDKDPRSAIERLQAHSTLQKILAYGENTYGLVTCILLFGLSKSNHFDIFRLDSHLTDEEIDMQANKLSTIDQKQLISEECIDIAEASLIQYFIPEYNQIYTGQYPNKYTKHLNNVFQLGYKAIAVEIDTSGIGVNLYSNIKKANDHHCAIFDFSKLNNEKPFLDFSD